MNKMFKRMKNTMALLLAIVMIFGILPGAVAAAGGGTAEHDKSKTATDLYDNRFADVTLSIPGEVETLATDIVFVVDKSSSDSLSSTFANGLFAELIEAQKLSGATIKVGVVIFNYTGQIALELTELTEDNYSTLLDSLPKYSGGTNIDAGLLLAKQMLDADTSVDASRKHVILISDGLTWAFNAGEGIGTPSTILLKSSNDATSTLYGMGTTTWIEGRKSGSYAIPSQFANWNEYFNTVKTWVANDGDKYVFDITNYKQTPGPDVNSSEAIASAVPKTEVDQHALNMDRALYDAWESYTALQRTGYNCYAYYTGSSYAGIGYELMKMLAGSSSMDFSDIKHDILYSVSKGSRVVDYIGYEDDGEESYNFDFVDSDDKLILKVGNSVYTTRKLESANGDATSSYVFTAPGAADATFTVDYFKGNGKDEEYFVWTIGEDVSRFAPVSLTYTLDLVTRSEIPGTHENVDTNEKATLYPVDSDGEDGTPEDFEKPKVEYTVDPVDVFVKKIWDDGDDRDGKRPESITVKLFADGEEVGSAELNADNEWCYTFEGLREFKDGEAIEYTIEEVRVSDYDTTIEGNAAEGFTITNTVIHIPVHTLGSIVVNKTATGATTPADATFQLQMLDGETWTNVGEAVAYSAFVDNAYTFTELAEGTYRVVESGAEVEEYNLTTTYSADVVLTKTTADNGDTSVSDGAIFVTNTYTEIYEPVHTLGSIVVNKTATGATTPADATFQLQKQDGETWTNVGEAVAYSAFVNNAYNFTGLEAGTYRVVEADADIEGYTLETGYSANVVLTKATADNGDTSVSNGTFTVTNAYEAEYIEIPDEDVPLASAPAEEDEEEEDDLIEIPDEDVPLADVPKTGDPILQYTFVAAASGIAAIGARMVGKKEEDEA